MPHPRIDLRAVAPAAMEAMYRLERAIDLDPTIKELVKLRASQVNGCAFCADMHWRDAIARGDSHDRLHLLPAWREAGCFTEREQAALELCEAMTLVADTHVPDATWARAAAAFPEDELGQLVFAITTINAWNRLAVTARTPPGGRGALATAPVREPAGA